MPESVDAYKFVNAYTFVPLGKSLGAVVEPRITSSNDEELLTGVIACILTTKSKVIVPAVAKGESTYIRFFTARNEAGKELPVIPASSIRGVVRGVYEAMTHSCMRENKAHDEHLATVSGLKHPGLLYKDENGQYVLYDAERYKIWDEKKCVYRTGDVLDFTWKMPKELGGKPKDHTKVVDDVRHRLDYSEVSGYPSMQDVTSGNPPGMPSNVCRGVFLRVNKLRNSHPSVMVGQGMLDGNVDPDYVACLGENVKKYKEKNPATGADYLRCYEAMERGECVLPVWYACQVVSNKRQYQFAYAQLSRVVFNKSVNNFYDEQGVRACPSQGTICPACTLFGYVSQWGGEDVARASRVRFADATLCQGDADSWEGFASNQCYLPELLEPRVSSFEFYLRNNKTPYVFTPELPNTTLAGRKFYWHHSTEKTVPRLLKSKNKKAVLNCKAEYVPKGKTFEFNVYVDGVTARQLNELIYALTLGEYWDEKKGVHCHKIGRGKPYGFGSASIEVTSIRIRTLGDGEYKLVTVQRDNSSYIMGQSDVEQNLINVNALRNIARLKMSGDGVSYPHTSESKKVFDWFSENRERFNANTDGLVGYKRVLPQVPPSLIRSVEDLQTLSDMQLMECDLNRQRGIIQSARLGNAGHWNGKIKCEGKPPLFFHTSRSPKLDLSGLVLRCGMQVSFTVGKNSRNGKPIACHIRLEE